MAYKKLQGDQLFDGVRLHRNKVLITTAAGTIIDVVPAEDAGEDVARHSGWLCPGFVNVHCHTELSHLEGSIPRGLGMVPFLQQVMFGRAAEVPHIEYCMSNAVAAMYQNGIEAVGDICNTSHGFAIKAASNLHFHHFLETSGFVPATASDRLQNMLQRRQQLAHTFGGSYSLVPHAPYSVSQRLLQLLANQGQAICSIHHQESAAELEFMGHKTGPMLDLFASLGISIDFFEPAAGGVLGWLMPYLRQTQQLILVHNCQLPAPDVAVLQLLNQGGNTTATNANKFYLCLCPNANSYIGNPLPNVPLLAGSGLPICVGTDSLASNSKLCIWSELQTLQARYPGTPTQDLLQWGTSNGALALGMEQQLGSFAPGKKPGILLLQQLDEHNLQQGQVQRLA